MDAIKRLIERAELLFERKQFKMLETCLNEIHSRLEETEVSDELWERFDRLTQATWEDQEAEVGERTCSKCHGSKVFRFSNGNTGACYDCQGKGFQTADDVVRVKNYWAQKRNEREQRKATPAVVGQQMDWPF